MKTLLEFLVNKPIVNPNNKFVDLGLPSGTLWAACNIGAKNPEEYGGYYSWGETQTKQDYSVDTYKFLDIKNSKFDKYGNVDNKFVLDIEDDVANLTNKQFCIPSKKQFEELLNNTTPEQLDNAVKLKSNKNSNYIIFPCAGCKTNTMFEGKDGVGYYFTNERFNNRFPSQAHTFICRNNPNTHKSEIAKVNKKSRYIGCSIRPVKK